jgi:hypothetical protein
LQQLIHSQFYRQRKFNWRNVKACLPNGAMKLRNRVVGVYSTLFHPYPRQLLPRYGGQGIVMSTETPFRNTELISQAAAAIEDLLANGTGAIAAAAWASLPADLRKLSDQPAPQPHPEPIAWMIGTAFWWTKEEAERDAEATGLPIVGLGPMPDAGEAALLRIELGHMRDERDDLSAKLDRFYSRTHGIKNLAAIEELSDKLADQDALLTDISKRHWSGVDFDLPADLVDRIKALSASAEPNAPGVLPRAHDVNMFQRTAEPGAKS